MNYLKKTNAVYDTIYKRDRLSNQTMAYWNNTFIQYMFCIKENS
jgi:hypothetical protein